MCSNFSCTFKSSWLYISCWGPNGSLTLVLILYTFTSQISNKSFLLFLPLILRGQEYTRYFIEQMSQKLSLASLSPQSHLHTLTHSFNSYVSFSLEKIVLIIFCYISYHWYFSCYRQQQRAKITDLDNKCIKNISW